MGDFKRRHNYKFAVMREAQFGGLEIVNQWSNRESAMSEFYRLVKIFNDQPFKVVEIDTLKVVFDNGVRYG